MRKLLSGFTLLLACLAVYAQAAMDEGASSVPSETEGVVWILLAVFAFFVMIGYFTWRLIKSEQKRQLESKKPDQRVRPSMKNIGEPVQFMRGEEYDSLRPKRYMAFGELISAMAEKK